MTGRVVSVKLKNTATVLVERVAMHPLYKKTFTRSKRYLVDDKVGVKEGDIVEIVKCKPVSKNKHWKIVKVKGSSFAEIAEAQLKKEAEAVISEVMPEESEKLKNKSEKLEEAKEEVKENKLKKGGKIRGTA